MAYGGSIAQVASNEIAIAAQQQAAQEARARMLLQQLQDEQRRRQFQQQMMQRDREVALQQENRLRDDALRREMFEYGKERDKAYDDRLERDYLLRREDQTWRHKQPSRVQAEIDAKALRDLWDAEVDLALRGEGKGSDKFTPEQNATLRTLRESARAQIGAEYEKAKAEADAINRVQAIRGTIAGLESKLKEGNLPEEPGWFRRNVVDNLTRMVPPYSIATLFGAPLQADTDVAGSKSDVERELEMARRRLGVLEPNAKRIMEQKGGVQHLTQDPITGSVRPTMPAPSWYTNAPVTVTGTNAPAVVGPPAPQPIPPRREMLQVGVVYQTSKGPGVWTGTGFDLGGAQ